MLFCSVFFRKARQSTMGQAFRICSHIRKSEGVRGLYRGYIVSLWTYGPHSGFYWSFYYLYSESVEKRMPKNTFAFRETLRIVIAGFLASSTAIIITNPLDVVRTRYQLQVRNVLLQCLRLKVSSDSLLPVGSMKRGCFKV